jgi:serine/threonine protein kinase
VYSVRGRTVESLFICSPRDTCWSPAMTCVRTSTHPFLIDHLIAQNISLRVGADKPHCRQVVAATAYLHAHSIVHRDLKPENILYKTRDPNSQLVIADFGIAKHLEPNEELTCTAGSVGYAAPEVLTGKGHGMKVDLWSIGWVDRLILPGISDCQV